MTKLRRLTAAALAAALTLTSMTAVFAADSATLANADKAVTLKDLGLYSGQDANDPKVGLENALTTQDSLIFLAKLFGYNEAANALTADQVAEALAKFDDAASISDYAKNVVAYSATNNILSGFVNKGIFTVGAKDTVTAARFATFMLKQMGYTVADYKTSVAKLAETQGSTVDATIKGDLTRDAAVGVMYGALTAEKASGKTVIADIVGDNADLKKKAEKLGLLDATADIDVAVKSVMALNCKQIEVVFNQEMDKHSVESEYFYEIYDVNSRKVELSDSSASLGSDEKTVTITLNKNVNDKLTSSSTAKVVVKKDIKASGGAKLAQDTYHNVDVVDGIIPSVLKAEATGERNIKITFSEPVYDKGNDNSIVADNFAVKSGTYTYLVRKATLNNDVINLEVGTKLIEGPVTVTVNNAGLNKADAIGDYAGYLVFKSETTFDYVKDTSVSVVTVKSAKANKVVLGFSKPVKASNLMLYHTQKNDVRYRAQATTTDYVDEITFTFDTSLPSGNVTFFLVNSEIDKEKMIDGYGVKVPDQTLIRYVTQLPPPDVTVKSAKENIVVLNFSRQVKGSNIRLYHTDKNVESNMAKATATDYVDEITFIFGSMLPSGRISLYLVNSETGGEKLVDGDSINVPNQSLTCEVEVPPPPQPAPLVETDTSAPVVMQCIVNKNEGIIINFNEKLNIETATKPQSYVVKKLSDNQEVPLSATIDDSCKSVELKFEAKLDDNTQYQLLIKNYQDYYGNKNSSDYVYEFTTGDNTAPTVLDDPENDEDCFAIAEKGNIIITYSEAMNEAQMHNKENYQVSTDGGITYIALGDDDSITMVDDRKVLIYVKGLKDSNDSTIRPYVKIAPITDLAGNKLYDSDEPYTLENIEPENVYIEQAQLIAKNKIKLVFNKKMGSINENNFNDFVINSTTPGAITVTGIDLTSENSGKTEVVFILNKELTTDAKDEAGEWVSLSIGNDPASESEWGGKLKASYYGMIDDKTAPEIVMWDHDNDVETNNIAKVIVGGDIADPQKYGNNFTVSKDTTGTITLYFSEAIKGLTLTECPFIVDGFTITDIVASAEAKTVILTVKADADNTSVKTTVTQQSVIYDGSDNEFAPGSTLTITFTGVPAS